MKKRHLIRISKSPAAAVAGDEYSPEEQLWIVLTKGLAAKFF